MNKKLTEKLDNIRTQITKVNILREQQIVLLNQLQLHIIIKEVFPDYHKNGRFYIVNALHYRTNYLDANWRCGHKIPGYKYQTKADRTALANTTLIYCEEANEFVEIPNLKMDYDEKRIRFV